MEELRPETKQRTSKAAPWFRNTETQIKGSTSFDFKGLGRDREKGYMLRKFEVSIFVGLCVNLSNSQLWMFYTPSSHRDCLCVLPAKCVTVCSSVVFNQKDCLQYDPDTHQHAHFLPNLSKFECWKLQFFFSEKQMQHPGKQPLQGKFPSTWYPWNQPSSCLKKQTVWNPMFSRV